MAEVSILQLALIIGLMSALMLSGICWCFCCGTCVGRDMLRMIGASRFIPPSHRDYRHQGYHMPPDDEYDEYQGSGQQWEMNQYPFNSHQLEV
ncbi:hypothetical protein K450DRAFT_225958 [Umbelopsis ramanniana AG]|uniref:Uncharacterized protein n=1 Tax=Umbelopsis ramanniana AG TaxID=1314678 RepID=A0AAD5EGY3_UMBRA|nr:uncharacterized protein K450DRAFT_225958 [Umbelopsis ramanniana AG]KAI8583024.1 hypothetical protein K450DRAFT_225958 [Umbelopsis ramanniana AG]